MSLNPLVHLRKLVEMSQVLRIALRIVLEGALVARNQIALIFQNRRQVCNFILILRLVHELILVQVIVIEVE